MRFDLDINDEGIKALIKYAKGRKSIVEAAMHDALDARESKFDLVTIKDIKKQIDKYKEMYGEFWNAE